MLFCMFGFWFGLAGRRWWGERWWWRERLRLRVRLFSSTHPENRIKQEHILTEKKIKNKNKNKNIVLCSCALIFTVPGAMGINKMNNNRCNYTHLKPSIHSWTSISNHVNISFNSYTHEHQQQHQVNNNIKSR